MTLMEVEERVNSFKRLGEEICRNIPDVLLATMNMLYIQYNKTRWVLLTLLLFTFWCHK